jgi:integrase
MSDETTKPRRKRGEGCIYQMRGSRFFWIKYYVNGRPVCESSGTDKEDAALRVLRSRLARVDGGLPVLPRVDRIRYDEVATDLRTHYKTSGRRDIKEAEKRLTHLDAFFTGYRVAAIGGAQVDAYVAKRQTEKAANGTINRELSILGRMFRLAYENAKLLRLPVIRLLKEAAPRAGFFEPKQFDEVRKRLRPDLQVAVDLAYVFGWRVRDEVLTLEKRHVDLAAGTVRLDPGSTKNRDGRVVYLTPALKTGLAGQLDRVRAQELKLGRVIPYIFPHLGKGRRAGERIRDFRRAWAAACKDAKCPGMLRHDFRRTAARNLVNAGVPERVAMSILGHKTRSVFDRYHIVSPADLQEAARRLQPVPAVDATRSENG